MAIRDQLRGIGGAVGSAAASGRAAVGSRIGAGRARVASGDWVRATLDALPAPNAPTFLAWEFSLGALVCRHPKVPAITARPLRLLDGLGAVRFGPETVGFDGEDIPWEKVVRLTTHDAFESMTTAALDTEVDRIRDVLPPLPGRKWAVTKVVEGLLTVVLASLEQADDRRIDRVPVACEITYRGLLGRERTLRASLFATALLARQTAVAESLVATARAHGVEVVEAVPAGGADEAAAAERTRALRARTDTIATKLRAQREQAEAVAAGGEEEPDEPRAAREIGDTSPDDAGAAAATGSATGAGAGTGSGSAAGAGTGAGSAAGAGTGTGPVAGAARPSDSASAVVTPAGADPRPGTPPPHGPSYPAHPSDATDPTDPFAC
ncbi:hypothetical protein [Embleya hyalina]|uniref:hypothetical protein n=1 Tax=Embleya hyalina TaxID=516124 RepID=UPI000F82F51C|nr:hypothetical protein [Embleya hyalina]